MYAVRRSRIFFCIQILFLQRKEPVEWIKHASITELIELVQRHGGNIGKVIFEFF